MFNPLVTEMNFNSSSKHTRATMATCLSLFFMVSLFVVGFSSEGKARLSADQDYGSIFPVVVAIFLLLAVVVVLAIRTTVVAWITVLVLLAFAGNRRRFLVKNGRKITVDVTRHLVFVVIKERGNIAVVFLAAVGSLMTVALLMRKLIV